ncbi:hypothetical protein [Spirosoma panaciterrae]|uniref:hypothetical protein n=1 Tax=Spirosoma panaciterrae TaxID=496058 RepID=UPI000380B7FD|nr:hypothetical protein [Spirosoma panaciterrae]
MPVIGVDADRKGEPVLTYRKPAVGTVDLIVTPPESDGFNSLILERQWQVNPVQEQ